MDRQEWAVKMCKALGHPVRFQIVKYLMSGPRCVCELNEDMEFSQSNLSQHLKILKEAGIVSSRKVGLKIFYKLDNGKINEVMEALEAAADQYYTAHLQ